MQRLISLFHDPEDDWPSADPDRAADAFAADVSHDPQREPKEPVYFAELMAYVRERNARFRWPREGAD